MEQLSSGYNHNEKSQLWRAAKSCTCKKRRLVGLRMGMGQNMSKPTILINDYIIITIIIINNNN